MPAGPVSAAVRRAYNTLLNNRHVRRRAVVRTRTDRTRSTHGRGESRVARDHLAATVAVDRAVPRLPGGSGPQQAGAGGGWHLRDVVLLDVLVMGVRIVLRQQGTGMARHVDREGERG